jgi:hypothetical protein
MGMVTRMSVLLKNYTLGVWVEGAGVSRNIAPWDTSDVVDEYAQADVVQVAPRSKPHACTTPQERHDILLRASTFSTPDFGRNAQIAVIAERCSERVKSTLCGP